VCAIEQFRVTCSWFLSILATNNNNNIYLVWPQRGTWLHRTTALRPAAGWCKSMRRLSRCAIEPAQSDVVRKQFSRAELEACEVWSVQGQRGTCVACGHPSPNLGRNLSPRGVFLPHPSQQVQRHSVITVTSDGPALPRIAALRAVVRCSQDPAGARPSKCIII
jgi:hypothetical protein